MHTVGIGSKFQISHYTCLPSAIWTLKIFFTDDTLHTPCSWANIPNHSGMEVMVNALTDLCSPPALFFREIGHTEVTLFQMEVLSTLHLTVIIRYKM